jgi:hypothetical protein
MTAVVPVSSLPWMPAWMNTTRSPCPVRRAGIGRPRCDRPITSVSKWRLRESFSTSRCTSCGW